MRKTVFNVIKFFNTIMLLLAMLVLSPAINTASARETSAKAACVLEATTGRVLYAYNENAQLTMASTTKVMTALVAIERGDLDSIVTCSRNAYGVGGTSIYLDIGETLTLRDMLYGLMLASGNDAAVAIAEHIGGTVDGFLDMMNERAKELGALNSNFRSPNGLPTKDHYTTAYDLALIAREAMTKPFFRELVSTSKASIPWANHDYNRSLVNKNKLLQTYEGATGIKTGFTNAAGRCLVFGAEREGMELVGVVLNCSDWFDESARLMDTAFANYEMITMLGDYDFVREIQVDGGFDDDVNVCVVGDLAAPIGINESPTVVVTLPERLSAPVVSGDKVGHVDLYAGDSLVARRDIVAAETVQERSVMGAFEEIKRLWMMLR